MQTLQLIFCTFVCLRFSIEDIRKMEIALVEWCMYFVISLFLGEVNFLLLLFFLILTLASLLLPLGLGEGDILMLMFLGNFLSVLSLVKIVYFASIAALLWIVFFKILYQKNIRKIPFLPFITFGFFLQFWV